ncbi:Quercetin 2,3-dioxygenase [Pseudodesulfovibrio hydrargyri]|uniref:Quercetin 2,3-dioxygenase n=1 Tax=Pseudodesulfovibrio hydrargyri TaxID=2125990 RepID=A0A1J5MTZ4_9BACT|nr:pirin family protein [Pseudodesulfovibrio hydrargyri]OIQ50101.1 Quercetin 2,3-dioxygenase [Pseudodesulfovibrio hydrargyri]
MQRTIKQLFKGRPVTEGAGVRLRRLFSDFESELFDPFLMLDDFRSDSPEDFLAGFPWHPHRGIETITYVTMGDVEHGDSLGNKGVITTGAVQWMTAGSGIIHQEMPKGDSQGRMHGFQLWANLPARDKMMDPRYRDITAADIPVVQRPDGTTIKVIAGTVDKARGPMEEIVIDPEYLDCALPPGTAFLHPTRPGHTVFVYVIGGSAEIDGVTVADRDLVLFNDGSQLLVQAGEPGVRFLLVSGAPLREPIAWRGPIVMNTEEELDLAFEEYRNGTFIKHAPEGKA